MISHRVSPPRTSTATSITYGSTKGSLRRVPRHKENEFLFKHGQRYHSFDKEKAPYPVSYDRRVLELQSLDRAMTLHLKNSVSFVDFKDSKPKRSLDLGCGSGAWIIDATKEWPNCEFIGFDLVNVQIPLAVLNNSVAERITWVHGNFLTTKLPFDDDEFDHVRIGFIARGVPENKWNSLFDEVNRVLQPGGSVELIEEDVIFPTLPRCFTSPLRVRTRRGDSVHLPDAPPRPRSPSPSNDHSECLPAHDHALLESLYHSVFTSRFISLHPTTVLPFYFTPYFKRVLSSPVVNFPMPPLAPLPPLPQQVVTPDLITSSFDSPDPTSSYTAQSGNTQKPAAARPLSLSFSSTLSASTSISAVESMNTSLFSSSNGTVSSPCTSLSNSPEMAPVVVPPPNDHSASPPPSSDKPFKHFILGNSASDSTSIGFSPAQSLLPVEGLMRLSERSLAMQLYYAYQSVLAAQEPMWEELKRRLYSKEEECLKRFGWDDDEELEELQSRKKFERLIERYRTDMQSRVSLWCSLCDLGWSLPPREPLSKSDFIEEERIHQALTEARKHTVEEDLTRPCRSVRVIVGYKSVSC